MVTRKTIKIAAIDPTESCKSCRFLLFKRGDGMYCRRYPPKLVLDYTSGVTAPAIPEVDAAFWCGDYQPALNS